MLDNQVKRHHDDTMKLKCVVIVVVAW